jgi:hypothetical protein
MSRITGKCDECDRRIVILDPAGDRILFRIFGPRLAEHDPGCPQYPDTTEVLLEEL